jgi:hypothetical protein
MSASQYQADVETAGTTGCPPDGLTAGVVDAPAVDPVPRSAEAFMPWTDAASRLDHAMLYWLATVRPDGRPHVARLASRLAAVRRSKCETMEPEAESEGIHRLRPGSARAWSDGVRGAARWSFSTAPEGAADGPSRSPRRKSRGSAAAGARSA